MRIRHQLAAAVFAAGSVGIGALLVNRTLVAREAIYGRLESRAQALADIVSDIALPQIRAGNREDLARRVRPLCLWPSLSYLEIWDAKGAGTVPWFQYTRPGDNIVGTRDRSPYEAADGIYDLYFNITDADGMAGTVRMGLSMRGIQQDLSRIAWEGGALGFAAILLLALASWIVGILLGRKLESLVEAVESLGNGELPGLPDERAPSEVGRLSRAFRDLNNRLLTEQRRRKEVEALKDDLTYMLVHDLKQPVTALTATLPMMVDGLAGGHGQGRASLAVRLAKKNVERLNAMIEDILQLARMHHSGVPVSSKRIPLRAFVEECAEDAALIAQHSERPWKLIIAPEVASGWIVGDEPLLRRLIGNLVLNAVDHSRPGASVTLGARRSTREPGNMELYVANQAAGVSPESIRRLFRKYQTTEENPRNVGLGLAFCKIVADRHAAKLHARFSEGENLEFALDLPLHEGDAHERRDAPKSVGLPVEHGRA